VYNDISLRCNFGDILSLLIISAIFYIVCNFCASEYTMEFPFSINNLLSQKITKIQQNLLPEGFSGDRRSAWYVSGLS
jgi:hypothetical protein